VLAHLRIVARLQPHPSDGLEKLHSGRLYDVEQGGLKPRSSARGRDVVEV
jgi:hypothetical protein